MDAQHLAFVGYYVASNFIPNRLGPWMLSDVQHPRPAVIPNRQVPRTT